MSDQTVFLEDTKETISYPGNMPEEDVAFHIATTRYKKSPGQALKELFSDVAFWERQEKRAYELGGAVKDVGVGFVQESVHGLGTILGVSDPADPAQQENRKKMLRATGVIFNRVFETFIGRIKEPIRQFVGDVVLQDEDPVGNFARAVIAPSEVEKISFRAPMTEFERNTPGVLPLIPRAVLSAVEDVFVYATDLRKIPEMVQKYQINAAKNVVQKNINAYVEAVKARTPYNDQQAMEFLSRPDTLNYISKQIKSRYVPMYAGVPGPVDPSAAGKAVGEGIKQVASQAAKSPAVAGKVASEVMKTRKFVESIQDTLPQVKVCGQYIPRSTDELAQSARNLIKDNIAVAEKMAMTGTDDKAIATGSELLKFYCDQADANPAIADALYEKAAALGNDMAQRLTELGRSVQAASILSRMTPEGHVRFAAKSIQKYNEMVEKDSGVFGLRKKIPELTAEQAQQIVSDAKAIEALPAGEEKAIAWKELQSYLADLTPTPLYKKILTIWKAGLLTGLKTSGLNLLSNASHAFGTELLKDIPATAVDSVTALFTGKRAVAFTTKGLGTGAREGFKKGWRFLKTGYDERNVLSKLDYKKVSFGKGKIAKGLQAYEEGVFKLLGAEDQPFYYGAKARSIAEQALVAAKNAGLKGDEAKAFIDNLIQNPTDDMVVLAVAEAETAVFQNETVLAKIGKGVQNIPGAEFILPFNRTLSAVATQIINYSPIGVVKTVLRNIGNGKFDQRDFSKGLGRSILGLPALWLGFELYKQGRISLDRPTSASEKELLKAEGQRANAIKIGDKWRSIAVLGPIGNVILMGGMLARAMESTGSITQASVEALFASAKSLGEQTFLTGVNRALDALTEPKKGEFFVSGLVSSFIPTLMADIAKATDTKERRVEGIASAIANRIPILRQTLEPQVDFLGQERFIRENFFETMFDASRPSTEIRNPVVREIRRLEESGFDITTTLAGGREGYDVLTPEQNTELWQRSGGIAFEKIASFMEMDIYDQMDDEQRTKDINQIIDKSRTVARTEKVIEITAGLSGGKLRDKLKEAKESGLMTKKIYELYEEYR